MRYKTAYKIFKLTQHRELGDAGSAPNYILKDMHWGNRPEMPTEFDELANAEHWLKKIIDATNEVDYNYTILPVYKVVNS
jgi:hypothetical protein